MVSILLTIVAKGCLPRPGPPKNPKRTSSCAITPAWAYTKHVPGRKTDVSDAQWLQRLHSHGLLRASFRPKGEIVELRAYLRQRERLLEYAASHIQHMQKGTDRDESAAPPRRCRHHRRDRAADHPRDPCGRA
jgi:hypothetical protein